MESVQWQNCFILHSRPYGEGGLIIDVLSKGVGRISLLADGVKRTNHPWRALLVPFAPLKIIWRKSFSGLKLTGLEPAAARYIFDYRGLVCAMYLNELLSRLLMVGDGADRLFAAYVHSLQGLLETGCSNNEPVLRGFERILLEEIGYGIDFKYTCDREKITDSRYYRYLYRQGFKVVEQPDVNDYSGGVLLRIDLQQWDAETLSNAKSLFSGCLRRLLGPKPLISRQLYR